ncbi:MAG: glycosyltransferase family 2 protein, partial [Bacteroidota bacterium]
MSGAVFWASVGLILYAHGGYPLVIFLLGLVLRKPISASEKCQPTVTIIITAYNEEKHIAKKLENTLHLDYPDNKLEIVVASDGSTDGTDEIVLDYSDRYKTVKLCRVEGRVGKTETQNRAVAMAKGEIVVFSDATTDYKVDAITKMVRNYADPTVGAVSGRYDYLAEKGSGIGVATTLFWRYENFIKSCQARLGTITGCCGCIYSVRKSLYERLDSEIISDLVEPLKILRKGYRIAFETEAIAWERTTERSFEELEMRIRVISRGMNGLWHMKELLNPGNYGFIAFQLLSHKVLRWW